MLLVSKWCDVIQYNHNDFLYFLILGDQAHTTLNCCSGQEVRTRQSKAAAKATSEGVWIMCERRGMSLFPELISMQSRIFFLRSRATAGCELDRPQFALCAGANLWVCCWLLQADSCLLSTQCLWFIVEYYVWYTTWLLTICTLAFAHILAQWMSGIWTKCRYGYVHIFRIQLINYWCI